MYKHKKFDSKFEAIIPTIKTAPVDLHKIFKKRKEQHESVQLRHDIIQHSKRQNYINEYDRIKAYLTHNIAHSHVSRDVLEQRRKRLKELFDESFGGALHELYNK